jgi:hypothetical protein
VPCDPGQIASTKGYRIKTAVIDPPFERQPGDRFEVEGQTIWLKRNGYYIDSRQIGPAETVEPQPMQSAGIVDRVYWQEPIMLTPVSTSLSDVSQPVPGSFTFTNQNGETTPAMDLEQIDAIVNEVQANADFAMKVLIAYWRVNGGVDNPDSLNGTQYVANLGAITPILLDSGN